MSESFMVISLQASKYSQFLRCNSTIAAILCRLQFTAIALRTGSRSSTHSAVEKPWDSSFRAVAA